MSTAFFEWLAGDLAATPALDWDDLSPTETAVLVIDLIRGFCHEGPLASPRVEALIQPVAAFLNQAQRRGVAHFWFCGDAHAADSPEFQAFPPHCLAGTSQSELHPTLAALDLGRDARHFSKGSLNAFLDSGLEEFLELRPELRHFVVVGDCTDLCVYSAAMHLRLRANARNRDWQVTVLTDLVDTYDLPLETALAIGAMPHPGDLCHQWALYQLKLNGCRLRRATGQAPPS